MCALTRMPNIEQSIASIVVTQCAVSQQTDTFYTYFFEFTLHALSP